MASVGGQLIGPRRAVSATSTSEIGPTGRLRSAQGRGGGEEAWTAKAALLAKKSVYQSQSIRELPFHVYITTISTM